jgi:hypothetical protein
MKYLTPELYVEINSAGDDEAERLYEKWRAAGAHARAYLEQIKEKLPPRMRRFCETMCLHDAEVLGIHVSGSRGGARTPVATINVRQDDKLIWLVYDLYEEPSVSTPVLSDVFAADPANRQWLYDEVDVVDEPKCRHQILMSTGEVIDFVFFQFDMSIHHSPRHSFAAESERLA